MENKLKLLGESAKYDVCASTSSQNNRFKNTAIGRSLPSGVCHSFTPDGRCISLFKVLLTNYCEKDCAYCPNRTARDIPRTAFRAEELAGLFMDFYRRNYVEGLFLSSGILHSTSRTMGEIIKVAELLRNHYRFGGYIHLKILPGSSESEIQAAAAVANRISLNMEAPTAVHLARLSHSKQFDAELLSGMSAINKQITATKGVTHSTQYIVGAAGESDRDIIGSVNRLYRDYRLQRAYFSAFQPVSGTPLADIAPAPLLRENRLYQSDFLLRFYNFTLDDLVFENDGNFNLQMDPKLAYALHHPDLFPLEINKAPYHNLLKIPGIGPKSAATITKVRREHRFADPTELKHAGIVLKRVLPFITVNGRYFGSFTMLNRPRKAVYEQLSLWGDSRDLLLTDTGFHH